LFFINSGVITYSTVIVSSGIVSTTLVPLAFGITISQLTTFLMLFSVVIISSASWDYL
jgi:hypothetical protein